MKLILEAIKALFRKVENSIIALRISTTMSFDSVNKSIQKAQNTANNALSAANTAQTTADSIQPDVILSAKVNNNSGYISVTDTNGPVNGRVYVFVPDLTATVQVANAYVRFNGTRYDFRSGVFSAGTSTSINMSAPTLFVKNQPLITVYNGATGYFHVLNHLGYVYLRMSSVENVDNAVPTYFSGFYSLVDCRRYKYMRVKSSTEGSTKLFDIQVDDSGTIAAVEVT